ncbi:MAG: alpha/beta hydrolase family protein, partial [Armatimonadota bacterium]
MDDLTVLPPRPHRPQTEEMMRSYLRGLVHEALDRRLEKYEALKTPEQIAEHQKALRQLFVEHLGGFPERTPLNARTVGTKTYDDYRIEKLIYESLPGYYVTALLFLPTTEPPYPGVLLLCGHTDTGKAGYQRVGILLAKNGMAALCPDPLGQGERKQILDDEGRGQRGATTEHMIAGVAPILLGKSVATYMIWDGMRALDYLASRPEVDASRIGCTGNSGGGNRTSYLMALDDRIVSAAPSCFITTTRRKNESPGPGDAEQNIHGQIAYGMDHPDYIIMRAPRPTLILSATQDYVPIEGAWEAFRQAKRIYTRLGHAERVDMVETDEKHGFSTHLRLGAVRWMRRWLLGKDDPVSEGDFPLAPDEDLQCSPDGQVLLMPGARSIFDVYAEEEQRLAEQRKQLWQESDRDDILGQIRDIAGIRNLEDLPRPETEDRGSLRRDGYRIDKLILRWEPGIELPALRFRPDDVTRQPYLYLHGEGKHVDAAPGGPIEKLVRAGHVVLAVDLRGCGETQTTPWRYRGAIGITGRNPAEFFIAYMLGKSFLGMRAEDVLVCARFLLPATEDAKVHVTAVEEAGPAALHAVALEPELFGSLTLRRSLISWSDVVHTPVTAGALINVVHGALRTYDLPDLVSLLGPERVTIEEPVDARGEVASVSDIYASEGAWRAAVGDKLVGRPGFQYVPTDPDLPRALLYGDSISIGYTPYVQELLKGKVTVQRISCNGGDTE